MEKEPKPGYRTIFERSDEYRNLLAEKKAQGWDFIIVESLLHDEDAFGSPLPEPKPYHDEEKIKQKYKRTLDADARDRGDTPNYEIELVPVYVPEGEKDILKSYYVFARNNPIIREESKGEVDKNIN